MSIYAPALPQLADAFGVDQSLAQITISIYFAFLGLGQLVIGPLSDRVGRRPVALWGLATFTVASLLAGLAQDIWQLIGLRVLQAGGGAAGLVLARTIVKDAYAPEAMSSALARTVAISAIVPTLSPAIGGVLVAHFSWRAPLLAAGLFAIPVLLLTMRRLPETLAQRAGPVRIDTILGRYGALLVQKQFLLMTLNATLYGATNFAFVSSMPFVLSESFDLGPETFGLWVTALPLSYMLGNLAAGTVGRRWSPWSKLTAGNWLSAGVVLVVAVVAAFFVLPPWAPFLLMSFAGFGHGIGMSNAVMLGLRDVPSHVGSAVALMGGIQMLGSAGGSALVSVFADGSLAPVLGVLVFLQGLLLIVFFAARPQPTST